MTLETRLPEADTLPDDALIYPAQDSLEDESVQAVPAEVREAKIPGFITMADSLVVRLSDGQHNYEAVLTADEREKTPVLIEDPRSHDPSRETYHLDSVATAVQVEEGDKKVWRDLPTRNVIAPIVTKDGIKVAILGAETPDRS